MTPRFDQKVPVIFPVKVIELQSRSLSHLKIKIFFGPGGGVKLTRQAE